MSTRKIIDLRSRPSFLHDFYGATPGTREYEVAKWLNRRVGSKHDEHFVRSHTLDGFVAEVRESGITSAVVVGRDTPSLSISNDRIKEITAPHEELIGIASVDPQTHGVKTALAEIERATRQLGLRGINVEPGFGNPGGLRTMHNFYRCMTRAPSCPFRYSSCPARPHRTSSTPTPKR